ncbi:MAG: DUF4252 domain-containing protein [Flavobacterium sp.]|uniref:DUF4252 domain-containing protein n=1 Tax=Flavobacterium sp. TaxID=239 RepID=UPI00120162E6|nr:DUF4252 domain-containing protein [Flavobacterium sp.]RZJ67829.1 MAG: DUF4252 domain-containing protein [Flavobacterium sp.]
MKKFLPFALALLFLTACSSEPSLQKYFVEKSEKPNFVSADISPSILNVKPELLTSEQQNALKTFKKMNVLAFQKNDSNATSYDAESAKVKEILKDEKYQELMHFGSGKDGGSISFVGSESHIDEFVLFANRKENGFAVVRVLGDDMTPDGILQMVSLLQSSNLDLDQLKPLQQIISNNKK